MTRRFSTAGRRIFRATLGAVLVLALGGPSPGHVGSCDGSAEMASPGEYCPRYRTLFCARELEGGRLGPNEYVSCVGSLEAFCVGFNFNPNCYPTQRRAESCLAALQDRGRFALPVESLPECNYCGGGV